MKQLAQAHQLAQASARVCAAQPFFAAPALPAAWQPGRPHSPLRACEAQAWSLIHRVVYPTFLDRAAIVLISCEPHTHTQREIT